MPENLIPAFFLIFYQKFSMAALYRIHLSAEEQQQLKDTVHQTKVAKHKRIHAQILLCLDENGPKLTELQASQACGVSTKTVQRLRKRCVLEGIEVAVNSKLNGIARPRKLDGEQQAHLVAISCSTPPQGRSRWTLKLLAERMVELEIVDEISSQTISRELKKTNSSLGRKKSGVSRPKKMRNS